MVRTKQVEVKMSRMEEASHHRVDNKFQKAHLFDNKQLVGSRLDRTKMTFDYPTMGIPKPGDSFDFRDMGSEEVYEYERQIAEWLRPYNVSMEVGRTQTVSTS